MLIRKLLISLLFTIVCVGLTGCFSDDGVDQKYFKTFEYIKTDQFVWSYGRGGIYWVSDDAVVLEALVENINGVPEKGLYQVSMDGSFTLLVSLKNEGPYSYCFDGENLYLQSSTGKFDVVNYPKAYSLIFKAKQASQWEGKLRPIRCNSVHSPGKGGGYVALKEEDGFIKNKYSSEEITGPESFIVDNKGSEINLLGTKDVKIVSRATYLPDRDAYFFYESIGSCANLSWLKRDDWSVNYKKQCFNPWTDGGSIIIISSRAGLYVEHHTHRKKYKTYFLAGEKEYPLETTSSRRAVVAPDGCKIAYGSGNYRARNRGPNDFRQVLKVFNSCQFMKDRGE